MLILNGQLYEPGAPEITLLNRSFKFGDGLFESIRVYEGNVLFLEDHFARLFRGMDLLKFEFEEEAFAKILKEEIKRLLVANQIAEHGRIRLHIYRAGTGTYLPLENQPYYLLEGYSIKDDYYDSPISVSLTTYQDLSLHYTPLSGCKTANSLPYVLASIHAREQGFDDAVLLSGSNISETSSANIFIVTQQKILTPPLSSACLDGVMRKHVLRLGVQLKLSVGEKRLRPKDLRNADEIFLTNTIRGIIPVNQYMDRLFDPKTYSMVPFLQKCLLQYTELNFS